RRPPRGPLGESRYWQPELVPMGCLLLCSFLLCGQTVMADPSDKDKKHIAILIKNLKSPDTDKRRDAAENLKWYATRTGEELASVEEALKGATPALIEVLNDGDDEVNRQAAMTLGHLGKTALPALITALKHKDARARHWAADAIIRIGW